MLTAKRLQILSFPAIFSPYRLVLSQYEDIAFCVVLDTCDRYCRIRMAPVSFIKHPALVKRIRQSSYCTCLPMDPPPPHPTCWWESHHQSPGTLCSVSYSHAQHRTICELPRSGQGGLRFRWGQFYTRLSPAIPAMLQSLVDDSMCVPLDPTPLLLIFFCCRACNRFCWHQRTKRGISP